MDSNERVWHLPWKALQREAAEAAAREVAADVGATMAMGHILNEDDEDDDEELRFHFSFDRDKALKLSAEDHQAPPSKEDLDAVVLPLPRAGRVYPARVTIETRADSDSGGDQDEAPAANTWALVIDVEEGGNEFAWVAVGRIAQRIAEKLGGTELSDDEPALD